ncbi:hypothetical protein N431DRAFT_225889 [Stipitochalara longipes BDJ]|nr:hypothetical protein N431DRAFT_225889 [Stipitochalara longipes BDJ]
MSQIRGGQVYSPVVSRPPFTPLTSFELSAKTVPVGGGFVQISSWEEYPLLPIPVLAPSDGKESFNVAVFHQLHCLRSIAGLVEELLASPDAATIRSSRRKHINHCFEYLRLSLRCCGDTTLEGQGKTVAAPGIDGLGSWHLCRDFESISMWASEHRASDEQGLPI